MTSITDIHLRNFRSYKEASLHGLASNFVVLTGHNGAGKTNILEAVSMLSPGRGMRSADLGDLQNRNEADAWSIAAKINTSFGPIQVGTGTDPQKNRSKRVVHIQGEQAKSQSLLNEYYSCLWLTPQMDRLFIDASSARRRFLDRMVFSFDAGHAGRVTRYENALSQRSKLLKEGNANAVWLDGLETQMAESGVAVAAARNDFVERLQKVCDRRPSENFPRAVLLLKGFLEEGLKNAKALEVEERFKSALKNRRDDDALTGGSSIGAHRTDFDVTYAAKNMPASECSTGEQKALLIGIVLAHADLINAERGASPLLLLDEVAAHLDPKRRHDLYNLLSHLGGQVWMSGTEKSIFDGVPETASFVNVEQLNKV